MKINTNLAVTVELTAAGHHIYEAHLADYPIDFPTRAERDKRQGSRLTVQLWELMQLFGKHMCNGCPVPFEGNEIDFTSAIVNSKRG